jgi:type II secretory pathway pseudopilin PulG
MKPFQARDESGFTLVELLVTCVVQSMIVGAIASSFFLFTRAQDSTKKRLQKTTDAQLAATYFITDAHAVSGPEVSLNDTTSCADPSPPVTGTLSPVARFTWSVTAAAGTTTTDTINYVRTGSSLMRRYCRASTLIDDIVVGSNIAGVTVTCSPTANCMGTPTTITISVTESQDSSETSPYAYTLSAAFRKVPALGTAPASPPSGPFPLVAFNSTGSGLSLTGSGEIHLNNSGTILIGSSAANPVQLVGSATITGAGAIRGVGACTNTFCPAGYSQIAQAPIDPYKGLAAPSTTGLPARAGCTGGTAQPGVYAATLSLVGSGTCTLASGVYVLQNGLSLTGSFSINSAAGGVFLYIGGGSLSLTGSGTISLSPMSTGTYANILVYQDRTSATAMTLTGSGTVSGYNGLIYAPAAPVAVTGSGGLAVNSLMAGSVSMTGSGVATIG